MTLATMPLAQSVDSADWTLARNAGIALLVVLWLATAYWTFKDARRRIDDPWLVALATIIGFVPPFLGPIVYLFFRPPEYIQDVRELGKDELLEEIGIPISPARLKCALLPLKVLKASAYGYTGWPGEDDEG